MNISSITWCFLPHFHRAGWEQWPFGHAHGLAFLKGPSRVAERRTPLRATDTMLAVSKLATCINDTKSICWQLFCSKPNTSQRLALAGFACAPAAKVHKQHLPQGLLTKAPTKQIVNNLEMPRPTGRSIHQISSFRKPRRLEGLAFCMGQQQQGDCRSAVREAVEDGHGTCLSGKS